MNLALSNKHLEMTIKCILPKIFNHKIEILFDFYILQNKTSTTSLNKLGLRHFMIISKYLFDRAESRP